MSCPSPFPAVEVRSVTVHPAGPCLDAEKLGDLLALEQVAHHRTQALLAEALREVEQLRLVAAAAHSVARVTTEATLSAEQESAQQAHLTARLLELALVLGPPLAQESEHEAALREEEWRALQPFLLLARDVVASRESVTPSREVCRRLLRAWQQRAREEFRAYAREGVAPWVTPPPFSGATTPLTPGSAARKCTRAAPTATPRSTRPWACARAARCNGARCGRAGSVWW